MGWGIVGHARAVDLLRRSIAHDRVSHAYLFSGPPKVGKRTLALEFARALNCERLDGSGSPAAGVGGGDPREGADPCNGCRHCRLIAEGKHPEVRVIGVQPPHRVVRVADIESIQSDAALRPADVRRKVYILEQAELLHPDAANRLLKTIEEPSEHVVMVLTTSDAEATLPTIVSRCQQVRLRALPRPELARYLVEARGLARERADLLAALGEGRVGWALEALADEKRLERRTRLLDELAGLVDADRIERLQYARGLADRWSGHPETVRETLEAWVRWWRDVLLLQRRVDGIVNLDRRDELEGQAARLPAAAVIAALASARDTLLMLEQNVNARLALDVAALDLPWPERVA